MINRITKYRESLNMSQADLALAANLPASSISHFEKGTRHPSLSSAIKLARALNCTLDELFSETCCLRVLQALENFIAGNYNHSIGVDSLRYDYLLSALNQVQRVEHPNGESKIIFKGREIYQVVQSEIFKGFYSILK